MTTRDELIKRFKGKDSQSKVLDYCNEIAVKIWEDLPKQVKYVMGRHNHNFLKRGNGDLRDSLMYDIWGTGVYKRQPSELAIRAQNANYVYAHCLVDGHWVNINPVWGKQSIEFLPNGADLLGDNDNIFEQLRAQTGLCEDHVAGECGACGKAYEVLAQDQKFWLDPSGECASCLKRYMVYADIKHNAREQRVGRKLHRFHFGAVPILDVPPGPAPSGSVLVNDQVILGPTTTIFQDLSVNLNMPPTPHFAPIDWDSDPPDFEPPPDYDDDNDDN